MLLFYEERLKSTDTKTVKLFVKQTELISEVNSENSGARAVNDSARARAPVGPPLSRAHQRAPLLFARAAF